jgi:hypothetical protein
MFQLNISAIDNANNPMVQLKFAQFYLANFNYRSAESIILGY